MTTPKNADLYYCEGSSDKEYHAQLKQEEAGWVVSFQYGRRGTALQSGTKTQGPVPYEKADAIYDKLVKEKLAKGYSPGAAGTAFQATPKEQAFTGILPQLLNPISEADLLALLRDPAWALQVKFDGEPQDDGAIWRWSRDSDGYAVRKAEGRQRQYGSALGAPHAQ